MPHQPTLFDNRTEGTEPALYMQQNTFYYHTDHLGSTNWVTDYQAQGYEHFTYTPYGEAWVEEHLSSSIHRMSHRFTGQELDPETGLYAFPARNYDPRTSRWLSTDPALEEYLPIAPTSDEAREHNQQLPGMGGVFNTLNLAVYHYGANNPLKYVDPDGRQTTPPPSIRNYMDQERMRETIGALAEIIFALGMVQGSENSVDATTGPAPQVEVSTGGDGERRITLFRAVNPRELASIEASGGVFSLDPRGGGAESKYFALTEGNAKEFAKEANQFFGDGPYTVVGTTFPENELTPDMFFTATDIPGGLESVAIPKKKLPLLTPAIEIETVE